MTVGGGVSTKNHVRELLNSGADKISINSSAVNNPNLIFELSSNFGSQCIVVAIDAKKQKNKIMGSFYSWRKETNRIGCAFMV